jgi:uncharacterized protein (TIGR02453 family)
MSASGSPGAFFPRDRITDIFYRSEDDPTENAMIDTADFQQAMKFLTRLGKNNNKKWFEANRWEYESIMGSFTTFVARLIFEIGKVEDLEGITPRDCIMRIHRDVRFSKDKSPYRTELGAGIVAGGRKSGRLGYQLRVAPGGLSMIASGLYDPTPQQLTRFRMAIANRPAPFKRILASRSFKEHFGSLWGKSLKTVPKGYDRTHPEIDLLRRTQVCAVEEFDDKTVLSPGFLQQVVRSMLALKPFIQYLNSVLA